MGTQLLFQVTEVTVPSVCHSQGHTSRGLHCDTDGQGAGKTCLGRKVLQCCSLDQLVLPQI